ncbi:sulfatase [Tunicatimonas pelagia]|uniref:sulfatase n=1 Tax=Tunicatimonas pelagia TaxID=931531 RepID=UPI00266633F7|nr:sulfatase [Tunicatimonas pelagia]WKN42938.1 sulfatase [Tunicatimonas pelagia]
MQRIASCLLTVLATLGACLSPSEVPEEPQQLSYNVVIFLIDDLGWTDLSCYGSDLYETPNIDRLAQEGVKFTNAYSACTVCSPTRAAIMTGKYPARLNITDWIAGHQNKYGKLLPPDWTKYLPNKEITIAEIAQAAGYVTASVGKWHLGDSVVYYPQYQGFDRNVAGYYRGQPPSYFYPYVRGNDTLPYLEGGVEGESLTDRLTDEASRFITDHAEQPFLLYFPHYAVHTPIQGKDSLTAYYQSKVTDSLQHTNAKYAAMIHSTDESVGQIMQLLDSLGISDQTLVIFTSDNGGLELRNITQNDPLRAGKGSAYEGGIRVPMIVRWPKAKRNVEIIDEPVITMDVFATVANVLGTGGAQDYHQDGVNLLPLLEREAETLEREALYWHYPHYHPGGASPYSAIRQGNYKLIEFLEDEHLELYNLEDDIGEANNLISEVPEVANDLYNQLETWRNEVSAQDPVPNPQYDSLKAKEFYRF